MMIESIKTRSSEMNRVRVGYVISFPRLDWVTYSLGQVQIKWNLLIPLFQPRSRGSSHGKEHFQDAVGLTQAKISK